MIECPVCGAHNFEYEETCVDCDSSLEYAELVECDDSEYYNGEDDNGW